MSESWTTLRVLEWTTERFDRAGIDSPRLDAQILLAHALSCDRMQLYMSYDRPLGPEELGSYRGLIRRRLAGEPVAYLIGEQEFWSLPFYVDASVLIPRPDTETIIQVVLEELDSEHGGDAETESNGEGDESLQGAWPGEHPGGGSADESTGGELVYELDEPELALYDETSDGAQEAHDQAESPPQPSAIPRPPRRAEKPARLAPLRIADIATGSGAIAVSLAHELRNAQVIASDLSPDAARLTQRNAERNGVGDRVGVRTGDLFAGLMGEDRARPFDIVVSNPPYIPSAVISGLSAEVRSEPPMALDGGADGLVIVRRLIAEAREHLRPGGLLVLEHGYDQADAVAALFAESGAYEAPRCRRDLGGNPRVSYARRRA